MKANKNFKKLLEKELNNYFYYIPCINLKGDDMYLCTCGKKSIVSPDNVTYLVSDEMTYNLEETEHLNSLFLGNRIINSTCKYCKKDLSTRENISKIQNLNSLFFERFSLIENENFLQLNRIQAGKIFDLSNSNFDDAIIKTQINESYIKINKITNKVYIKKFDDNTHKQIHLNDVFDSILCFFKNYQDISQSDGYIFVHDWIGRLAKTIRDSKNMNIVDELLNFMIGKSGFDILGKIAVIFISTIIYPNLSTISLTKGNIFLFDLIANCPLPDKNYLKRKKATSPLKIFNTLVTLKNKKLQEKLDNDDKRKLQFIHISNQSDIINKLKNENISFTQNNDNLKKKNGKIFIRDEVKKRTISPFVFNKIIKFSDYEKSIEWLRIVKYEQFIELLNKYDLNFLLNAYKVLEFREDLNFDRIKQFLILMMNYCIETLKLENGEKIQNYSPVLNFDFNMFDDCYRMIEELKWDPKKVLFKIKSMAKLHELHENLIKQRSYINNNELNMRFIEFSKKFKFLETYSQDLDINLKIELIETPEGLMNHAISMHNCAGSYVRRVANGEYLSFIVNDESPKRTKEDFYTYMMVLEITSLGLEFVGIKAKFNKYGSNRFKEDVKKYLLDKDINFKDVPSIKTDIQSNEVAYKGFFEKIIK